VSAPSDTGGTPFHDLARYVAIPRLTSLRLAPDGSWLAAAVQTLAPDRKKYLTSIWSGRKRGFFSPFAGHSPGPRPGSLGR